MKDIEYTRHEFHADPQRCRAGLPFFLLDIPYLFFGGVIPPLAVMNGVLKRGGGDAGMSPGASWEPFTLTEAEYEQLIQDFLSLDLGEANRKARFVPPALTHDPSLHNHRDLFHWLRAVREKYPQHPR